ncbi:MAG TPA: maleylacetoacetate isomerase [Wenzhouxiangella sp.]
MSASDELVLYGYWRSSASYRVRLALAIKGLAYIQRPVSLIADGGEHRTAQYRALNPQALVPTLIHQDRVLTQSLAIIEYLDELFPSPPLLPDCPHKRAITRAIAHTIASDTAPIQNLRVLDALEKTFGANQDQKAQWAQHWIQTGLEAVEAQLQAEHPKPEQAQFCVGDSPSLADCCLLPQVYNAERFGCDLADMPTIRAICANLGHNEDIMNAKPDKQPDAPKT